MANATEDGGDTKAKSKGGSLVMTLASIVVLTLVGGGGGWFLGGMIAPKPEEPPKKEAKAEGKEEGAVRISTEANGVVLLEPITTNLAYPSSNWIRLELALLFRGAADVTLSETIHQDVMAYLRTVSLQQLEGPRGFQYLKEDIQERVDLRSEGRVSKIMFRTFVIE